MIKGFTEANTASDVENRPIRLGRIDYDYDPADFLGGINPRVLFDGEKVVSQKRYTVMSGYYPLPGARVVLIPVGTTYMIIGAVAAAPQDPQVDIFTDNDTWDKTPGARIVRVQVQAGGGAGGGVVASPASDTCAGGGGAGGGYGESWFSANAVGATETVTVGTGGTGGTGTGGNGTTSSFGSYVSATGGPGGGSTGTGATNAGISGATAASETIVADLAVNGSGGGAGMRVPTGVSMGGAGGNSRLGGGGRGVAAAGNLVSGTPAAGYGGGGGGAVSGTNNNAAANGGDGSPGIVIVTTYF
ncbi:glycine-rich domain-containing protein [Streptomyces caniscabiei]|uniref:glycine-rich domain-containing protein n=1 Tax=Streptomyces caniscabiei TaxID=2746961 RepID=UPI0038F7FD43